MVGLLVLVLLLLVLMWMLVLVLVLVQLLVDVRLLQSGWVGQAHIKTRSSTDDHML